MEHQLVVIECLDDPDETLKRKTLELLCRMTNPSNVEVICEKLIGYLRSTVDSYLRSDLVQRITLLAEQYAPNNEWFIRVMTSVFELGGDLVKQDVAQNLMRLIAEGSDDDNADAELRLYAVSSYLNLMDKPNLPDILVQVIAWVVGEYSYLSDDVTPQEVLHKMCALLDGDYQDSATRGWILTATLKVVSQMGSYPVEAQDTVEMFSTSIAFDLQQRCCEMKSLASDLKLMQEVMPVDASCEDLEVDLSLSFLNGFVSDALTRGAAAYQPSQLKSKYKQRESKEHSFALNFQPYDPPTKSVSITPAPVLHPTTSSTSPVPSTGSAEVDDAHGDSHSDEPRTTKPLVEDSLGLPNKDSSKISGLAGKTPRVWGKSGYLKKGQPSPAILRKDVPSPTEQEVETETCNVVQDVDVGIKQRQTETIEQDTWKQELASALFSGVGSTHSSPSVGGTKSPRPKSTSRPKKLPSRSENPISRQDAVHPVSSAELGTQNQTDLLGLDFTGLLSSNEQIADSGQTKELQSAEAQSEQTAVNHQPSVDLLLDLQGLNLTSSVPLDPLPMTSLSQNSVPTVDANVQRTNAEQLLLGPQEEMKDRAVGKLDRLNVEFSFMTKSKSPSPPAGTYTNAQVSLMDSAPASIGLPDDLKHYPSPTSDSQDLCSDGVLRLCCRKVYSPAELIVVFFLTNQKSNQLSKVTTQLEVPANLKGSLLHGSSGRQWEDDIEGFATIRHVVQLKGHQPGVNMSLRGQVSYRDTTQQKLFFSLTIHISDLLRPLSQMGTDEFGHQWSSGHWHDRKLKITTTIRKQNELMEKIKQRLNLHAIQIIGQEGIASGSFLQTSVVCLVHSKVLFGGQVELWIKTGNSLLTDLVAKQCQSAL
jgi:AP-4 complex subunit epsilon-1